MVRECERTTESEREEKPEEISSDRFVTVAFDKNKYFVEKLQQQLVPKKNEEGACLDRQNVSLKQLKTTFQQKKASFTFRCNQLFACE